MIREKHRGVSRKGGEDHGRGKAAPAVRVKNLIALSPLDLPNFKGCGEASEEKRDMAVRLGGEPARFHQC